jgi:hypothetical protein
VCSVPLSSTAAPPLRAVQVTVLVDARVTVSAILVPGDVRVKHWGPHAAGHDQQERERKPDCAYLHGYDLLHGLRRETRSHGSGGHRATGGHRASASIDESSLEGKGSRAGEP